MVGAQGATGVIEGWTAYQDFNFDRTRTDLTPSQMDRVSDIAAYLTQNPSLDVGIDGSLDGRGFSQSDRRLSDNRAASLRGALIQAGVPASRIKMGAFADPARRQQGQIQLLIKTA
ncbi:MAG: OmpA family protein [Pseudomonadota bacterium]